jgi:ribonuclease-3
MLGRRSTSAFEKRLGYRFKHSELLALALTHRSRANEEGHGNHYERLEFLGDAVLGLVVADWLYRQSKDQAEGELSKRKAVLVSRTVLAEYAASLDLGTELRLGVGEERSGGRAKPSLLADSLEAVIGAVYLDGGIEPARKVVHAMVSHEAPVVVPETGSPVDPKSSLQEALQARGWPLPDYRLVGADGPQPRLHDRVLGGRGAGGGRAGECQEGRRAAGRCGGP